MKKYVAIAVALVAVLGAGWYLMQNMGTSSLSSTANTSTLGTYAYECDEHVTFSITPSSDMSTIVIAPLAGSYPESATLAHVPTNTGVRFEGGEGLVLVGVGEGVILGEGDDALNCSPVAVPGEAPFNFGN